MSAPSGTSGADGRTRRYGTAENVLGGGLFRSKEVFGDRDLIGSWRWG